MQRLLHQVAQKALNDLRPFLRFADGMKDSDAELPKARSTSVPRASSKPRSRSSRKRRGRVHRGGQRLLRGRSRPVSTKRGSSSRFACLASLSWLALLLVLILHLSTLPLTLLCPPTCMIRSGRSIFCNGLLMIVACLGRKVSWRGLTFTWGCTSTPLHRSIPLIIFGAWQHAASAQTLLYPLAFAAGLADSLERGVQ